MRLLIFVILVPTFRSKISYTYNVFTIDFQSNVNLLDFYAEVKKAI